jgi:endonuclease III-like uncharacterized protein
MASKILFNKAKSLMEEIKDLENSGVNDANDPSGLYKGKVNKLSEILSGLNKRQIKLLDEC